MNATLCLMMSLSVMQLGQTEVVGMTDPSCEVCQGGGGFSEFSSPCNRCKGRRCKTCCKDSTCNLYPHYAYPPEHGGYYYFRPYNYTNVLAHQQTVTLWGGDARNPYSRAMFVPVYEQFENTTYEPNNKPSQALGTLPELAKKLPDIEDLLKAANAPAPQN